MNLNLLTPFGIALTFTFLTYSANSQSYTRWIEKADSISNITEFKSALDCYEEALQIGFEDKEKISQDAWIQNLRRAGQVAYIAGNTDAAVKYWNLATGKVDEKLDEKINTLQFLGVKNLIVFNAEAYEKSFTIFSNGCSNNETKHLLWWHQGKCFLQKFTECNTYPTIEIINKIKPIVLNLDKFKNEEISPVEKDGLYQEKYILDFYQPGGKFSKEIKDGNINSKNTHINTSPIYHKNRKTNLYSLVYGLKESVEIYETILTSGKERKKRGQL